MVWWNTEIWEKRQRFEKPRCQVQLVTFRVGSEVERSLEVVLGVIPQRLVKRGPSLDST